MRMDVHVLYLSFLEDLKDLFHYSLFKIWCVADFVNNFGQDPNNSDSTKFDCYYITEKQVKTYLTLGVFALSLKLLSRY